MNHEEFHACVRVQKQGDRQEDRRGQQNGIRIHETYEQWCAATNRDP